MKVRRLTLPALLALAVLLPLVPASADDTPLPKFAFLTHEDGPFHSAIRSAEVMEEEFPFADFRLVVAGEVLRYLASSDRADAWTQRARQAGITVEACGLSLREEQISAEQLPEGITTVPEGIMRMYQLALLDYVTLSP